MAFRWLLLLCFALPAYAAEVAGVKLADTEDKLVLNGAGLRKKFVFQVYVVGLYLAEKKASAADAIGATGAKRIAITMLRDVEAAEFSDALTDGMKSNVSEVELKALEPRVKQLVAIMGEMKVAKNGMRITLDWSPAGTQLTVDGKPTGQPIAGEDFYRALLRIWLGEHPVQDDLKKALLGEMSGSKP